MNRRAVFLTVSGAKQARVQVIEHDNIEPAGKRLLVRPDVVRDRPAAEHQALGALHRQIHVREHGDLLRLAVFEDLKIFDR